MLNDRKIHLIFGVSICMYLICFILVLMNWMEKGCTGSFIVVIISALICETATIALLGLFAGVVIMLIKIFLED